MVIRKKYLNQIMPYVDKPIVKILTGIRRSGKSTILEMVINQLLDNGISKENIISLNLDSYAYESIKTGKELYEVIKAKITNKRCYVFIDEIQEATEWEKCVNSLMIDFDVDIYITGSNSKLMSSEISTYLTGRYVNINVYPLTYLEYLEFKKANNNYEEGKDYFNEFIKYGGFPIIANGNYSQNQAYKIVEDIYTSVIFGDIVKRNAIRKLDLFNKIVSYIFENASKTFSASSIVKYLKSENRTIDVETIYNYINYLKKAYLIYPAYRYDIQGKEVLKTNEKYYLADFSLKFSMFGYNPMTISKILENIVFIELKSRGYDVYVGKDKTKEIDFVATKNNEKIYLQVCRQLPSDSTREIDNLKAIKDNYPKYVLSNDPLDEGNDEGIKIMYLANFLLKQEW